MVAGSNLSWQGIQRKAVYIKERQCALKGQARYVNVRGSVHCRFLILVKCIYSPNGKIYALDPKFVVKRKRLNLRSVREEHKKNVERHNELYMTL